MNFKKDVLYDMKKVCKFTYYRIFKDLIRWLVRLKLKLFPVLIWGLFHTTTTDLNICIIAI